MLNVERSKVLQPPLAGAALRFEARQHFADQVN
jgi:hypothetical protein